MNVGTRRTCGQNVTHSRQVAGTWYSKWPGRCGSVGPLECPFLIVGHQRHNRKIEENLPDEVNVEGVVRSTIRNCIGCRTL